MTEKHLLFTNALISPCSTFTLYTILLPLFLFLKSMWSHCTTGTGLFNLSFGRHRSGVLIWRRNDKRKGGWEQVVAGQQIQGFSRSPGTYGQCCSRAVRGQIPTRNRCSKQWDVPPLWSEWTAELFTTKGPFSSAAGQRTIEAPSALTHWGFLQGGSWGGGCMEGQGVYRVSLCWYSHFFPSFSVLRWISLRLPLHISSTKPPPPKATAGQGFKCHAWPSERPAPGSCLPGEARQETGWGREESWGEGDICPCLIVHCDRHELLTDSKSSVSSRHASWTCPAATQRRSIFFFSTICRWIAAFVMVCLID